MKTKSFGVKSESDDTIAAIATLLGESAIGIVRISGKDALRIADKIFLSKDGTLPSRCKGYTLHYGWIVDNVAKEEKKGKVARPDAFIDEALLTVMRPPRSYTCEEVVEINCHGGIVALRNVLKLVLESGCRLAQPGEFTKRAFLNGRIDLSQAEAVCDVIRAKTDSALAIGLQQLKGALSQELCRIRDAMLEILSVLEAHIDFPEDQIDETSHDGLIEKLDRIYILLHTLVAQTARGRIYREGIRCVICGRPNVGKSSLLNALLKHERSIVTPVPGTTRDTIEEMVDIRGIPVRIVDTAGIMKPAGAIERKAIQRTNRSIDSSDVILLMFDASAPLTRQDRLFMRRLVCKRKPLIAVLNKIDLKVRIEHEKIRERFSRVIELSAKRAKNLHRLEEAIDALVCEGKARTPESILVSNERHAQAIKQSKERIGEARSSLREGLSYEFIAQDIKEALGYVDDVLGKRFSQDLLDRIFDNFCIGK